MKVVIDTNVLVSAFLNAQSLPAQVFNLVLNGKLQVLYTNTIITEYSNVLYREKFGFPPSLIEPVLDLIQHDGELVVTEPTIEAFTDSEDRKFYETLISGEGQFLITGNLKHFPEDSRILNPREFLDAYTREADQQD